MRFKVESINISKKKGVRKDPVGEIELVENRGIKGDAHYGPGNRQVSFLANEAVDLFIQRNPGLTLTAGAFGENINTRGMDWTTVEVGKRIWINELEMEVTQIGKTCHDRCAIYEATGECIMPTQGIFARVIKGGKIHAQDSGDYDF